MRNSIDLLKMALRTVVFLAAVGLLAGCAVVKINDDATDTVDHGGGEEAGKQLANLACHKARAVRAEVISTVQKTGAEHDEKARYTTTFRCLY
jgi:hypothetical protein